MKGTIKLSGRQRELVLAHHSYAKRLARQYYRQRLRGDLDYEDFEGAAMLGLCDAASRFDPERGQNFPFFATRRIRGAMIDLLRSIGSLPRMYFMRDGEDSHEERQALPYVYSAAELAGVVNSSSVLNMRLFSAANEVEAQIAYADHLTPEDVVVQSDSRARLRTLIEALPEKERSVVSQYYFSGTIYGEMKEAAAGSTKSWLSRLHHKGLARLRKIMLKDPELHHSFAEASLS